MLTPPRIELARLPTPLVRLERLGHELGDAQIWVKRDDLTGLELSGNKVRKLEYVTAAARAAGGDALVTEGTSQSNHCRATAAVCARLGLRVRVAVAARTAGGDRHRANHLLDTLFGAELRDVPAAPSSTSGREEIVAGVLEELRAGGAQAAVHAGGGVRAARLLGVHRGDGGVGGPARGGGHPRMRPGARDFVGWDVRREPAGQAAAWARWGADPGGAGQRGCRASPSQHCAALPGGRRGVRLGAADRSGRSGRRGVGAHRRVCRRGVCNSLPGESSPGIRLLARAEALVLDPVYTGKAFCALLEGVRQRRLGFRTAGGVSAYGGRFF